MGKKVDELLDQLRHGEFHVDCVRMELVRKSDGKKFVGPGYIRQKATRDFEIKMYAEGKIEFREIFMSWGSKDAGVLYGESDHFSLLATDASQRTWRADRIINPSPSGHAEREGYVVTADCQEVALVEQRWAEETGTWMELQCFDPIKFPCTGETEETIKVGSTRHTTSSRRNVAEFESCGLAFCFEEHHGLRAYASVKEGAIDATTLHPQLEWRVTEAITFSLGIVPRWSRITRCEGTERVTRFRSHEARARKPTQWPPYKIEVHDGTGSVWRMFDCFLRYTEAEVHARTHPLARHVFAVAHARGSSAEGVALAVAVAVESLLGQFYASVGNPDSKLIESVENLIRHIQAWKGDPDLIGRAVGSIGNIKSARADDRLRVLVASGTVGEAEWLAWKKLRNTAAHGNWYKYEGKLQILLDLTGKVAGLFNQLVFNLIGYTGQQTDYGAHGWPTIEYPLKA